MNSSYALKEDNIYISFTKSNINRPISTISLRPLTTKTRSHKRILMLNSPNANPNHGEPSNFFNSNVDKSKLYDDTINMKTHAHFLKKEIALGKSDIHKKNAEIAKKDKIIEEAMNNSDMANMSILDKLKDAENFTKLKNDFKELKQQLANIKESNERYKKEIKTKKAGELRKETENQKETLVNCINAYDDHVEDMKHIEERLFQCKMSVELFNQQHLTIASSQNDINEVEKRNHKHMDEVNKLREAIYLNEIKMKKKVNEQTSLKIQNDKLLAEKKNRENYILQKPIFEKKIAALEEKLTHYKSIVNKNESQKKELLKFNNQIEIREERKEDQNKLKPFNFDLLKMNQQDPSLDIDPRLALIKSLINESKKNQEKRLELIKQYEEYLAQLEEEKHQMQQEQEKDQANNNLEEDANPIDEIDNNENSVRIDNLTQSEKHNKSHSSSSSSDKKKHNKSHSSSSSSDKKKHNKSHSSSSSDKKKHKESHSHNHTDSHSDDGSKSMDKGEEDDSDALNKNIDDSDLEDSNIYQKKKNMKEFKDDDSSEDHKKYNEESSELIGNKFNKSADDVERNNYQLIVNKYDNELNKNTSHDNKESSDKHSDKDNSHMKKSKDSKHSSDKHSEKDHSHINKSKDSKHSSDKHSVKEHSQNQEKELVQLDQIIQPEENELIQLDQIIKPEEKNEYKLVMFEDLIKYNQDDEYDEFPIENQDDNNKSKNEDIKLSNSNLINKPSNQEEKKSYKSIDSNNEEKKSQKSKEKSLNKEIKPQTLSHSNSSSSQESKKKSKDIESGNHPLLNDVLKEDNNQEVLKEDNQEDKKQDYQKIQLDELLGEKINKSNELSKTYDNIKDNKSEINKEEQRINKIDDSLSELFETKIRYNEERDDYVISKKESKEIFDIIKRKSTHKEKEDDQIEEYKFDEVSNYPNEDAKSITSKNSSNKDKKVNKSKDSSHKEKDIDKSEKLEDKIIEEKNKSKLLEKVIEDKPSEKSDAKIKENNKDNINQSELVENIIEDKHSDKKLKSSSKSKSLDKQSDKESKVSIKDNSIVKEENKGSRQMKENKKNQILNSEPNRYLHIRIKKVDIHLAGIQTEAGIVKDKFTSLKKILLQLFAVHSISELLFPVYNESELSQAEYIVLIASHICNAVNHPSEDNISLVYTYLTYIYENICHDSIPKLLQYITSLMEKVPQYTQDSQINFMTRIRTEYSMVQLNSIFSQIQADQMMYIKYKAFKHIIKELEIPMNDLFDFLIFRMKAFKDNTQSLYALSIENLIILLDSSSQINQTGQIGSSESQKSSEGSIRMSDEEFFKITTDFIKYLKGQLNQNYKTLRDILPESSIIQRNHMIAGDVDVIEVFTFLEALQSIQINLDDEVSQACLYSKYHFGGNKEEVVLDFIEKDLAEIELSFLNDI